jgi:hypothetical protein
MLQPSVSHHSETCNFNEFSHITNISKKKMSDWNTNLITTVKRRSRSRGTSGSIVSLTTGWTIGRSRFDPRQGQIFLLAPASRLALGPTQPPIQWVLGVLSPGVKRVQGVTLTTRPHLVPRLRMSRSYTSSPPICLHGM